MQEARKTSLISPKNSEPLNFTSPPSSILGASPRENYQQFQTCSPAPAVNPPPRFPSSIPILRQSKNQRSRWLVSIRYQLLIILTQKPGKTMFATRSNQMARCKEELKMQLLMAFPKKPRHSEALMPLPSNQVASTSSISQSSTLQQNETSYNILNQFSKSPYLPGEQKILSRFMQKERQSVQPNYTQINLFSKKGPRTVEAFVQTIGSAQFAVERHSPFAQSKAETISTIQPFTRTPAKQDEGKSLINVSKNLTNFKYEGSDLRRAGDSNNILTESMIENEPADIGSHKKCMPHPAETRQFVSNQEPQDKTSQGPQIKRISLSRSGKGSSKSESQGKQGSRQYSWTEEPEPSDNQKLTQILSKKSSLKELIQQKSLNKSSQIPKKTSKWEKKGSKKSPELSQIDKEINQDDIMDLFPPYESSSSTLEAVIEEQNSELEESIQIQPAKEEQKAIQEIKKKESDVSKNSSNLKSVSFSDLSLEDVSEINIEDRSGHKNFINQSSLKKITSDRDERSGQKNAQEEDDWELEKQIVSDIGQDIKGLQRKIQSDFDSSSGPAQSKPKQSKSSSRSKGKASGSEGGSNNSMLEFFDKVNDELDFKEISRDIMGLKKRMTSESSF